MLLKKIGLLVISLLIMGSCQTKKSAADYDNDLPHCPAKPTALFDKTMTGVTAAAFELRPTESVETVVFADSTRLVITQTGCAKVSQNFEFTLLGKYTAADGATWAAVAVTQFRKLAAADQKLQGLGMWAQFIEQAQPTLHLGEPIELEPHRFLRLDRVVQPTGAVLIVRMYES
jgi:hypothetical protein